MQEHFHRQTPQTVRVGKVDATANPGIAAPFDIKGYPTLLLLRDGMLVAEHKGARTFEALVAFVEDSLSDEAGLPAAPKASPRSQTNANAKARREPLMERLRAYALNALTTQTPVKSGLMAGLAMLVCCGGAGLCFFLTLVLTTKPRRR